MNAITRLPLFSRTAPALAGERLARARLARTARIGPLTFHEMLGHYGSAEAALEALPSLARRAGFTQAPVPPTSEVLLKEVDALGRLGGRLVVYGDPDYPQVLAQVADAPPLLSVIGDSSLLSRPALAVVGARNASTNGRRVAVELAGALGSAGLTIVSGLARGIDTAAHRASLATGTIAVLAGGVDVIYPPENEALYSEIAARGLVVAEAPLSAVPQARHFPRRNRIVSGLSMGVLVIEAALQSGSLITARQAADQGREVFAVPGSPLDPRCRGSNRLLRDGATLVETAEDVLAQIGGRISAAPPRTSPKVKSSQDVVVTCRNPPIGKRSATAHQMVDQVFEKTDKSVSERILACLSPSPVPVDEVIRQCHVSPALVTAALLDLELSGRVERLQGNMVVLI